MGAESSFGAIAGVIGVVLVLALGLMPSGPSHGS